MLQFLKEFKEFAVKGNMIDIAVGVIIGAAFNKVIDAIVKQLFMPPLSLITNGINFENKKWILQEATPALGDAKAIEEIAIGYGKLIESGVDFIIIGITVFIVVKSMNRLKNRAQDVKDPVVKTPKDIELLDQIASLLEKQNELLKENKIQS